MTGGAVANTRAAWKPAIFAGVLFLVVIVAVLVVDGRGPSSFVRFGQHNGSASLAAEVFGPSVVPPGQGHDGAYFWVQARDPLLLDRDVYLSSVLSPGARSARPLYPALVAPWRLGGETAVLWGMVVTNLALVVLGTYLTARLAMDLGGPESAGLAFALNPVVFFGLAMDLADVALCVLLVGFVWAVQRRRWGPALVLAALVALTKESGIFVVAFVAVFTKQLPLRFRIAAPAVAGATFVAWSAYARWRLGWPTDRLDAFTPIPFKGVIDTARFAWFPEGEWVDAVAGCAMLVLGAWIVVRWVRRRNVVMTAAAAMAVLLPFYSSYVFHLVYDSTRAVAASLTFLAVDVLVARHQRSVPTAEPIGVMRASEADGAGGADPAVT
jgi:hypothetical protein